MRQKVLGEIRGARAAMPLAEGLECEGCLARSGRRVKKRSFKVPESSQKLNELIRGLEPLTQK